MSTYPLEARSVGVLLADSENAALYAEDLARDVLTLALPTRERPALIETYQARRVQALARRAQRDLAKATAILRELS